MGERDEELLAFNYLGCRLRQKDAMSKTLKLDPSIELDVEAVGKSVHDLHRLDGNMSS